MSRTPQGPPVASRVVLYRWVINGLTGIAYHWAVHIEGKGWYEVKADSFANNGEPLNIPPRPLSDAEILRVDDPHSERVVGYSEKSDIDINKFIVDYKDGKVYDVASRNNIQVNCQDFARDFIKYLTDGHHTKLFWEDSPFGSNKYSSPGIKFNNNE